MWNVWPYSPSQHPPSSHDQWLLFYLLRNLKRALNFSLVAWMELSFHNHQFIASPLLLLLFRLTGNLLGNALLKAPFPSYPYCWWVTVLHSLLALLLLLLIANIEVVIDRNRESTVKPLLVWRKSSLQVVKELPAPSSSTSSTSIMISIKRHSETDFNYKSVTRSDATRDFTIFIRWFVVPTSLTNE